MTLPYRDAFPSYAGPADDPQPRPDGWIASVALILRPTEGALDLLLIRRADVETDPWSGHMAFPGGRRDPTDRSLLETAIRETLEETAIDLDAVGAVLGRLDVVQPATRRLPPLSVLPFVFSVPATTGAVAASVEVAEIHWIPVSHFEDSVSHTTHDFVAGDVHLPFPAFSHGDRVIWGLTERILRDLLRRIRRDRPLA